MQIKLPMPERRRSRLSTLPSNPIYPIQSTQPCVFLSSPVFHLIKHSHIMYTIPHKHSIFPHHLYNNSAQVLHTPTTLKYKSSSSTNQKVLPKKHVRNIPKKNDQNSKESSVNKQNSNNKGQLMSWMKRKLSPEKESDTTNIVKLSRSESDGK